MSLHPTISSLLLLLAAILTSWLVVKSFQTPLNTAIEPQNPDSFMANVTGVRMNVKNGLPEDQLFTPLLVHYPQGDATRITTPHFVIFNTNGENPWHIYANNGRAQNGLDILYLWDKVRLVQAPGPRNQALTATTSELTIFPKQQTATTQQIVTLKQTNGSASSVGLRADLKTGAVELLSRVHGEYFSASPK